MSVLSHISPRTRLLFVDPCKLSNYNVSKFRQHWPIDKPSYHKRTYISCKLLRSSLSKISENMFSRLIFLRDKAECNVIRYSASTHKVPMGAV
jgi:hypothetical protein